VEVKKHYNTSYEHALIDSKVLTITAAEEKILDEMEMRCHRRNVEDQVNLKISPKIFIIFPFSYLCGE
jgi:hypothetical protein